MGQFIDTGRGDTRQIAPNLLRLRAGNWRLYLFREGDYAEILRVFHRSEEPYEPHIIRALIRDVKMLKEARRRAEKSLLGRSDT